MATKQHLPSITVKIDGNPVPSLLTDAIAEIVVDSSLHLPDMFTIRIQDPDMEWANNSEWFDFGKTVEISILPAEAAVTEKAKLIDGEITALEPELFAEKMNYFLVRGYNRSNRLHLGHHSRTFTKRKDSDIVKEIARDVGLEPQVDDTSVTYDYVLQNNQTNMEFLATRAQRIGYQVYASDGKLYFKKGDSTSSAPMPELEFGRDLRLFRPRMTTAHQSNQVRVQGWDSKGKQPIRAMAKPNEALNQGGMTTTGGATAGSAYKLQDFPATVVDLPVTSIDEASAIAQGLANDISNNFVDAEGVAFGMPGIMAGRKVKLKGMGKRWNGDYFVTAATHRYDLQGYSVSFIVNGRRPNTFSHLLQTGNGASNGSSGKINGVVVGLVTNLNDPDNLGRVKVKFPWLIDAERVEIESTWAKISAPTAGQNQKGFYCLPEIEDEVLVAFEHGDPHRPYIVGALWNNKDRPPKPNNEVVKSGKVVQRIFRSRRGHEIVMDDSEDAPSLLIRTESGHEILLDDTSSSPRISLKSNGGHEIVLDDTSPGRKISVKSNSGHQVVLDDTQGSFNLTVLDKNGSNGMILDSMTNKTTIKAGQILQLEASQIILAAQTSIAMSAPGGSSLESDGPVSIKSSSTVSLEGSAIVSIQGGVVKIN